MAQDRNAQYYNFCFSSHLQPAPKKHFTLKRKPKSAAVKADLIQKSVDLSSNMKKNVSPAVPVRSRGMPRKMTDTSTILAAEFRLRIS